MLVYVYCRMTRYNCIARKLDYMDRPTSTKDGLEHCHHISCAFLRVSKRQWKGFCRAAERARSPARPFNRVNGKAALDLPQHQK